MTILVLSRGNSLLVVLLAGTVLLMGCSRSDQARATPAEYRLKGEIVAVLPERKSLVVKHEEIPGFMPAMAMEFVVTSAEIAALKTGQHITARLVRQGEGDYRLESIFPYEQIQAELVATKAAALRQETSIRGKNAYRAIGEKVPDFALYDQNGRAVSFSQFRGKRVILDFIYTRCPIATMCPASTLNMMTLQRLVQERGLANIEFVSVSLDPDYDTPAVLKEYAAQRGINTSNFSFLTGPESAVRDLLLNFGVIAERQESIIKHTLSTLLIDERGTIIHRVEGTQWRAEEFAKNIPQS
jgi:protein SCO1/2